MNRSSSPLPVVSTALTWTLFLVAVGGLVGWPRLNWTLDPVVRIDGLAQIMAVVVTFVSGIVQSFSRRYMAGSRRLNRFYAEVLGLTIVVLLLTAANHLVLFWGLWTLMGLLLADLIGHVRGWPEAQASSRYARRMFLGGSALLGVALALLVQSTGVWTVTGILTQLQAVPGVVLGGVGGLLVLAAMVQSALVPFHRWLLSSMTAPTPVSAFMHAGLVNAGGILIARFAPVVFSFTALMWALVLVGGLSALMGQAWMLVQTDVKRQLGCSTVAQMGFMILQCGLGFIPAAITHLILHGFYKAYLFLGSGSVVAHKTPDPASSPSSTASSLATGAVALATGLGGGALFALLTGKSLTALGSGTVLVVFVVMAVLHATRTLIRRSALSPGARLIAVPAAVLPALGVYAGVYNGITALLGGLPAAVVPNDLSAIHVGVAAVFFLAYLALEAGWHRASPRLYVALRNSSQPLSTSLLTRRDQYHAH